MYLTQIAFMAVLLAALTAAFARGGRPERIGAALLLGAALLSPAMQSRTFRGVETGLALLDAALFLCLLALALRSHRRWAVVAAAFQAVALFTHIARIKAGPVSGNVYGDLLVLWSYPVTLALLWGALVEAARSAPAAAPSALRANSAGAGQIPDLNWPAPANPEARSDLTLLTQLLHLHHLGHDSAPVAAHLLSRAGTFAAVVATPPSRLRSWGMDQRVIDAFAFARSTTRSALRRSIETRPGLRDALLALDYLHNELAYLQHEQFRVLYLNATYRLILDEIHGEGSVTEAPIFPREVLKQAVETGAVHIILAHNHPSGDPTPSRADIAATRAIIEATRVIGVSVLDHFVISTSGHTSMRAMGLI